MKTIKLALTSIAVATFLTACGGGGDSSTGAFDTRIRFAQVVTFGDSLSDVGTYQVGTIAALGGGKFTINGVDNNIWSQALAASLGAGTQCAAQTGLLPNNGVTGAAVVNNALCNNYAQGKGCAHHDYRAVLAQVVRATFALPDSAMASVLPDARWDPRLDGLLLKTRKRRCFCAPSVFIQPLQIAATFIVYSLCIYGDSGIKSLYF